MHRISVGGDKAEKQEGQTCPYSESNNTADQKSRHNPLSKLDSIHTE